VRALASLCLLTLAANVAACRGQVPDRSAGLGASDGAQTPRADFVRLIDRLSEPGGYFDTDNLISNEASYLHVIGALEKLGVRGGAYLGVGPDQNFSYIAHVRPHIAFIVDIRRDNLLEHLLFKALFELADTRAQYLSLLTGRPVPNESVARRSDRSIVEIVAYFDETDADVRYVGRVDAAIRERIASFGVSLSDSDWQTIARFHRAFIDAGLGLRFASYNRPPRWYYPTLRDLILERDLEGRQASYLASEDDYRFVRSMQQRDLVIPVVGDLAGNHALARIGQELRDRSETVSAFYTSNVEFYLWRQNAFENFIRNVSTLPHDEHGVIIRSFFNRNWGYNHPESVPGYHSTQLLQGIEALLEEHATGGIQSYLDLVTKHSLTLR